MAKLPTEYKDNEKLYKAVQYFEETFRACTTKEKEQVQRDVRQMFEIWGIDLED